MSFWWYDLIYNPQKFLDKFLVIPQILERQLALWTQILYFFFPFLYWIWIFLFLIKSRFMILIDSFTDLPHWTDPFCFWWLSMAAKDISRKGSLHVTTIGTKSSFFTISNVHTERKFRISWDSLIGQTFLDMLIDNRGWHGIGNSCYI